MWWLKQINKPPHYPTQIYFFNKNNIKTISTNIVIHNFKQQKKSQNYYVKSAILEPWMGVTVVTHESENAL